MAKKKTPPASDIPMIPDPVVVQSAPVETPSDAVASVDASSTAEPVTTPTEEPAADARPVVTFDRPPVDVEMQIRVEVTEGKDLVAMRTYRTWANGREAVDTEGGPAKLGLLEAQDAIRWLVLQPRPEGAITESPPAEEPVGEVVYLASAERPVLTVAPPAPTPREKVLATRSIQHEYSLTDEERIALGSSLANLEADVENEEADQSAKKRAMRERLSALKGERARVADIIRRGAEVRTIAVIDVADYEDRIVRTMREDTCEVIATRPMDAHESQLPLFSPRAVESPTPAAQDDNPFDTDEDEDEDEDEEDDLNVGWDDVGSDDE